MQWDKQLQLIDYYHDSSAINGMVFLLKTLCTVHKYHIFRGIVCGQLEALKHLWRCIDQLVLYFFRHVSIKFIEHLIVAVFCKWPFAYCYFIKLLK